MTKSSKKLLGFSFRSWLRVIVSISLLFVVQAAGAQTSQADSRMEAIRQKMEEGQGLFLAKNYEAAATVFEQGYELYPYSAFLFNAGVCFERLGRNRAALAAFERYLEKDPDAPDAALVAERMTRLSAELSESPNQKEQSEGALPPPSADSMKSLVVIETEPTGAPVLVYQREEDAPKTPFSEDSEDWRLVARRVSPVSLTLAVGHYHIVVSEFREFNRSETDMEVSAGHVHHFRANLSQGQFMGFLEVKSNVLGAKIYIDPEGEQKTVWGETPHNALVAPGAHHVVLEAPGFVPSEYEVFVEAGEKQNIDVQMSRVGFGVVRIDADVSEVIVYVDERIVGSWRQGESALEVELLSGQHEIVVTSKGYKELRKVLNVPRGQLVPLRAKMIEKPSRSAAWTQAILAAGFLGAGVYLGVASNHLNKDLSEERAAGRLHADDPDLKKGFWFSIGANSAFLMTGVLGGLSAFNFVRDPLPEPILYRGKTREFERMRTKPSAVSAPPSTPTAVNRASVIYTGMLSKGGPSTTAQGMWRAEQ